MDDDMDWDEGESDKGGRDAACCGRGQEVACVPEIVEEILGQLPISHLYSSCRLVCHKWNDIIQREKAKDLVQVLLDAQDKINEDSAIAHNKIVGLAFDMLLGGFETSALTLSYITHLLATHPDVQKRLQEKIDKYFETEPEASLYNAMMGLKYLDMVINESMRLHTTAGRTQHCCLKTFSIRDVTIPEGVHVAVPINVIHHLPQYWPDPYKFDPERCNYKIHVCTFVINNPKP